MARRSRGYRFALSLATAGLLVAWVCASSAAAVPDPMKPGPLSVNEAEYHAGEIALTVPQADGTTASFTQPVQRAGAGAGDGHRSSDGGGVGVNPTMP